MKSKSKRSFTLLEIVVCVLLLTMVAGFVGFQTKELLGARNFAKSANELYNLCKMGRWLSLAHQDEIHLQIRKKGSEYYATLFSYSPLPILKHYQNIPLSHVDEIKDQMHQGKSLDVIFSPRGDVSPPRIFALQKNGAKKYVNLSMSYLVTMHEKPLELEEVPFENPLAASPTKK